MCLAVPTLDALARVDLPHHILLGAAFSSKPEPGAERETRRAARSGLDEVAPGHLVFFFRHPGLPETGTHSRHLSVARPGSHLGGEYSLTGQL